MTVYSSDELKKLRLEEHASLYAAEAMASRVSCAQEIPVTKEMIAAGEDVSAKAHPGAAQFVSAIYRAMAAVAPVALVSDAELRVAALEVENKELRELYMMEVRSSNEWFMKFQDLRKQAMAPPTLEPKAFPAAALKSSKSDPRRVGG